MAVFLSNAWFDEVAKLNAQHDELNLPPTLATLIINFDVSGETNTLLHLKDGKIHAGHHADAISQVQIDQDALNAIISTKDMNLAIEAFMTGKIRIHGDMNAIMSLQSAKPSQEQKQLYKDILAMTQFA